MQMCETKSNLILNLLQICGIKSSLQPESVYGSFIPDFKEYHESVDGRVKLIHEFFIQIGDEDLLRFRDIFYS
jgi:hypothetical protein